MGARETRERARSFGKHGLARDSPRGSRDPDRSATDERRVGTVGKTATLSLLPRLYRIPRRFLFGRTDGDGGWCGTRFIRCSVRTSFRSCCTRQQAMPRRQHLQSALTAYSPLSLHTIQAAVETHSHSRCNPPMNSAIDANRLPAIRSAGIRKLVLTQLARSAGPAHRLRCRNWMRQSFHWD